MKIFSNGAILMANLKSASKFNLYLIIYIYKLRIWPTDFLLMIFQDLSRMSRTFSDTESHVGQWNWPKAIFFSHLQEQRRRIEVWPTYPGRNLWICQYKRRRKRCRSLSWRYRKLGTTSTSRLVDSPAPDAVVRTGGRTRCNVTSIGSVARSRSLNVHIVRNVASAKHIGNVTYVVSIRIKWIWRSTLIPACQK